MQRTSGVTTIAALFFTAAAYLVIIGVAMLGAPDAISLNLGTPLLHGLELDGPYIFLRVGAGFALIGWELWRLHNWARWAAILVALWGIVMLVPRVSAAAVNFHWPLLTSGFQITVRAAIIWYLLQVQAKEAFGRN
jgi:hypothetical protein